MAGKDIRETKDVQAIPFGAEISSNDPIPDGFDDFHSRCNETKHIENYFKSDKTVASLQYDQISRILSVGTACGKVDSDFLSLCKNAEQFVGIEPVPARCEEALENMSKMHRHIKVTFYNGYFEDYEGPDEKVDLLLLSHVLYHFKDLSSTIKRAAAMVKSGGKILIINSYGTFYATLGDPSYVQYDEKIREAIEDNNLTCTEEPLPDIEVDLTHAGNGYYEFLHMIMLRSLSIEERKECIGKLMKTVVPGTNIVLNQHTAFIIQK